MTTNKPKLNIFPENSIYNEEFERHIQLEKNLFRIESNTCAHPTKIYKKSGDGYSKQSLINRIKQANSLNQLKRVLVQYFQANL